VTEPPDPDTRDLHPPSPRLARLLFVSTAAAAFCILAAAGWRDRSRRVVASTWLLGVCAYAVLELLAPVALDKHPLRYLAIPALLVTAGSLVVLGSALCSMRPGPVRLVAGGSLVLVTLPLFVSNLRQLDPNEAAVHYQEACSLVLHDVRGRRPRPAPSRVLIAVEVPQLPSLVWYGIACNVYSDYLLQDARYVTRDVDPADVRAADVAYYISWKEPESLPPDVHWRPLESDPGAPRGTPAVFVAEPAVVPTPDHRPLNQSGALTPHRRVLPAVHRPPKRPCLAVARALPAPRASAPTREPVRQSVLTRAARRRFSAG